MFSLHEFVWTIINFVIFLIIIRAVFYKPVLKVLDDRKRQVESDLSRAEQARREAEELQVKYQEQVGNAQREAQELLNQAARMAEEKKAEIVAQAQGEATRMIEKAQEAINREKERALAELRDEVANLALLAAGKVINKALTAEDHHRLVKDFIQEVGNL